MYMYAQDGSMVLQSPCTLLVWAASFSLSTAKTATKGRGGGAEEQEQRGGGGKKTTTVLSGRVYANRRLHGYYHRAMAMMVDGHHRYDKPMQQTVEVLQRELDATTSR